VVEFRAPRPLDKATRCPAHDGELEVPVEVKKQTNQERNSISVLPRSPTIPKVVFIHVHLVLWPGIQPEQTNMKREIEKRLNHLMSVLNDAWRYLDICFVPSALAAYLVRLFLSFVPRTKRYKKHADEVVGHSRGKWN
jgi:hypothetical protein